MSGTFEFRQPDKQVFEVETHSVMGGRSGTFRTPLLDIEGVAAWLGTSHRHVRRLVAERRIPYVKVGHLVRFDGEEVARWIDGRRVGSRKPLVGS